MTTRRPAILWRLETAHGEGIFRHYPEDTEVPRIDRPLVALANWEQDEVEDPPVPQRDPGIGDVWMKGYHYSAFASIAQARRWFTVKDETDRLATVGVRLLALAAEDCDDVIVGVWQAIYHPRAAVRQVEFSVALLYDQTPHQLTARAAIALRRQRAGTS